MVSKCYKCGAAVNFAAETEARGITDPSRTKARTALLERGIDVNADRVDPDHWGFLISAIIKGDIDIVRLLVQAGTDVNRHQFAGSWTPLMYACGVREGWTYLDPKTSMLVLKELLDAGADVHATDEEGHTALLWGVRRGLSLDAVRMLVSAGANVNVRKNNGATPLHPAVERPGYLEVVEFLIQQGADVNARNNYGHTPLMQASLAGHGNAVKMLICAGADVNAVAQNGATALSIAVTEGHTEVAQLLKDAGAVPWP